MSYDFDTPVIRKGTGCVKFDARPDLDPFWVADMDFLSPPCILDTLRRRVEHGVFGYAMPHEGLLDAVDAYLQTRRGAEVPREQWIHIAGLVPALSLASRAFCRDGESLMTCTPVYPPFLEVHRDGAAGLITVDHVFSGGRWTFDWEAMEKAVTPKTRLFLLCNPQNPMGRAFTREEVERVAEFCRRHRMLLVSDEIHCDLVLDEARTPHVSALTLPEELRRSTITLLAPSKTWNIAGLGYSLAIIPDPEIRARFNKCRGHTLPGVNALAYYAAEAAYRDGEPWRQELLAYLRENRRALDEFFPARAPRLKVVPSEATYLAWIDAREFGVRNPAKTFEEKAGLFLSDGAYFGWPGWIRLNFGCTKARLLSGLEKLAAAI